MLLDLQHITGPTCFQSLNSTDNLQTLSNGIPHWQLVRQGSHLRRADRHCTAEFLFTKCTVQCPREKWHKQTYFKWQMPLIVVTIAILKIHIHLAKLFSVFYVFCLWQYTSNNMSTCVHHVKVPDRAMQAHFHVQCLEGWWHIKHLKKTYRAHTQVWSIAHKHRQAVKRGHNDTLKPPRCAKAVQFYNQSFKAIQSGILAWKHVCNWSF